MSKINCFFCEKQISEIRSKKCSICLKSFHKICYLKHIQINEKTEDLKSPCSTSDNCGNTQEYDNKTKAELLTKIHFQHLEAEDDELNSENWEFILKNINNPELFNLYLEK